MKSKAERRVRHETRLKSRRVRDTARSKMSNKEEIIQSKGNVYKKTFIDGMKFFTKLSIDKE